MKETDLNGQLSITPKPLMELIPTGSVQDASWPCPNIIQAADATHPLLSLIVPQNLFELSHQLSFTKESPTFADQPGGIDDVLGEKVDDFQKLVVCFPIIQCAFDAIEELTIVVSTHGRRRMVMMMMSDDDRGGACLEVMCESGTTRRRGSDVSLCKRRGREIVSVALFRPLFLEVISQPRFVLWMEEEERTYLVGSGFSKWAGEDVLFLATVFPIYGFPFPFLGQRGSRRCRRRGRSTPFLLLLHISRFGRSLDLVEFGGSLSLNVTIGKELIETFHEVKVIFEDLTNKIQDVIL